MNNHLDNQIVNEKHSVMSEQFGNVLHVLNEEQKGLVTIFAILLARGFLPLRVIKSIQVAMEKMNEYDAKSKRGAS